MRKPATRSISFVAALVFALATSAAAQDRALNRVADGGFESGWVSLSLPATGPFPLFSGGWASRGSRTPEILGDSFDGSRALRVETRPSDSLQVLQDVALQGAAYGIHVAFFIEHGTQTVRLLNDWDRDVPGTGPPAFEAVLSTAGIRVATPAGSWRMDVEIDPLEWHGLTAIADPRSGTLDVRLDDRLLLSLPGVSSLRRSTLVLAAGIDDRGAFRYDTVEATSLIDLELAAIEDAATALDITSQAPLLGRFATTRAALDRGSSTLALAELRVARNLVGSLGPEAESLEPAIAALMRLIAASDAAAAGFPPPSF